MKLTKTALLLSCLLSGIAVADALTDSSGFWLGAGLGAGQLEEMRLSSDNTMRAFSGKVDVGYDFTPNLGIYASYDYMQYIPVDKDLHLGSMGLRGMFGVSDRLSLVGKMGVTHAFDERSDSGFARTLGLGLEYQLTHAVSLKTGVDYYSDLELRDEISADLFQAYVGLNYRFGQPEPMMEVIREVEVIKEVEVTKKVEVIEEVAKPEVIILEDVTFMTNSNQLASTSALDEVVDIMQNDEALSIRIVGHTDATGNDQYNQRLSLQRAESVAQHLRNQGVDSLRMVVTGQGESEPIANNATAEGRQKNRRVEMFIQ